jgi:hypothetical protein
LTILAEGRNVKGKICRRPQPGQGGAHNPSYVMATVTIGQCSNNQSHTFSIKSSFLEWNKTARAKTRLTIRSLPQIAISPTEVRKISKQLQTLVNPLCFLSKILKTKNPGNIDLASW